MKNVQNKYLVAYIKDDFAQIIIVNAPTRTDAQKHIETDPDCHVYKTVKINQNEYDRLKSRDINETTA